MIKRMRVEPISTYLERYRKGGVAHPVTIANGFVYLSGLPPPPAPHFRAAEKFHGYLDRLLCP